MRLQTRLQTCLVKLLANYILYSCVRLREVWRGWERLGDVVRGWEKLKEVGNDK